MHEEERLEMYDADELQEIKKLLEEPPQGSKKRRRKSTEQHSLGYELYLLLHDLVYILACVTVVFVFAIRLVGVDGDSMYPTLHHADYLGLLSNVVYDDVENGDVVVMTVPFFENEPIVKRVIATGGQTVDIDFETGEVFVDGELLDEPYINELTRESYEGYGQALEYPIYVEEGYLFVMGDNRNHSTDSRFAPVGLVDERDVLGKVLGVILPGKGSYNGYADCKERDFSRIGSIS